MIKQLLELAGVAHLPRSKQLIEQTLLVEGFKEAQTEFAQASSEQEAQERIAQFRDLVNRNQVQGNERNIDFWRKQGWEKFNQFVTVASETKSITQEKRAKVAGKSINIHEDSNWLIVVPLDKDASCFHGKNTDWYTTKPNAPYFEQYFYDKEITLIYFLKLDTGDKWAIACHSTTDKIEMFDKKDNPITEQQFQQQTGFNPIEYRDKVIGSSDVTEKAAHSRQVYKDAVARIKSKQPFNQVDPQLEADLIFVKNTKFILEYCQQVKRRWPRAEPILATSKDIVKYVIDVLHRARIPEVEKLIRIPDVACTYAIDVIQGRWQEKEPLMAQSELIVQYVTKCLGDKKVT